MEVSVSNISAKIRDYQSKHGKRSSKVVTGDAGLHLTLSIWRLNFFTNLHQSIGCLA